MITEDYVSFEIAELLKEKGFRCATLHYYYDKDGDLLFSAGGVDAGKNEFVAPTLQMAMKWLREVHGLHFWIAHKLKQNKGLPWYYEIHNIETGTVVKIGDVVCGSYEVACEAAIKYCLEKLI